jgi:hypothetical protein
MKFVRMTATLLFLLAVVVSCGSSTGKSGAAATPTSTGSANTTATDPATTNPTTTDAVTTTTSTATRITFHGRRYCELLLVKPVNGTPTAAVYNSFPLNGCPAEKWDVIDTAALARSEGVTAVIKNGPRFWLMDHVDKATTNDTPVRKTFGGIEMTLEATVAIGDGATTPYTPHAVTRATTFTFDKGNKIYELTAPDGTKYVMQTFSQQIDPKLGESDLVALAARLHLPSGWAYSSRVITEPLQVVTVDQPAQVLQDDLGNSYSMETAA